MFKFFIYVFFIVNYSFSQEFIWGNASKIGLTNNEIELIIKQYVEKKYPKKVKEYHLYLKKLREQKLEAVKDLIFLKGDLVWQDDKKSVDILLNSLEAKNYCKNLSLATKNDWRLPTYNQLLTLVNYYRYEPAKIDGLKNIASERYWTSDTDASDISANWYVNFRYGQTGTILKFTKLHVKCVRDLSKVEGDF